MKFLLVPEEHCVYLPDRKAANLFLQPDLPVSTELYGQLINLGFRRSGNYVYRPFCKDCRACISVRLPAQEFTPNRSQKRIARSNAQLEVTQKSAKLTDEQFALYKTYVNARHEGSSMTDPEPAKTEDFFSSRWCNSHFYEFREGDELLMVAVVDEFADSLSAVYTYFNPYRPQQSLGVYGVLWQIAECQKRGLPYLHLGFWVDGCQKMSYKANYRPLELLIGDNQWHRLNKGDSFDPAILQMTEFDKQHPLIRL